MTHELYSCVVRPGGCFLAGALSARKGSLPCAFLLRCSSPCTLSVSEGFPPCTQTAKRRAMRGSPYSSRNHQNASAWIFEGKQRLPEVKKLHPLHLCMWRQH